MICCHQSFSSTTYNVVESVETSQYVVTHVSLTEATHARPTHVQRFCARRTSLHTFCNAAQA